MATGATPPVPGQAPLYQSPFTRSQKATVLFSVLAVALIVIGALAAEGLRSPTGPFGELGRALGDGGVAGLFVGAAFSIIASYFLWKRESKTRSVLKGVEVLQRDNRDFKGQMQIQIHYLAGYRELHTDWTWNLCGQIQDAIASAEKEGHRVNRYHITLVGSGKDGLPDRAFGGEL